MMLPISSETAVRHVRKRDGVTIQLFDFKKIESAVRKAWKAADTEVDEAKLRTVTVFVANTLPETDIIDIEHVQDAVEVGLMKFGHFAISKHYILYRQKRAEKRAAMRDPDPLAVANYIHFAKYAKYRPDLLRRELYLETVSRTEAMHLRRFPQLAWDISWAFDRVREKRVLPSMRSFQFAGPAIEANENKIYNCAATLIDRPEAVSQAMFLLLAGCGVGYSIQYEHVEKLPKMGFVDAKRVVHHVVGDTIEGWADACKALIQSFIDGHYLELSYHLIRAAGTPLKTSGGRAPGHMQLKISLERIREVLDGAQGRRLRPIEWHRILCHAADTALSGGIRRSAMIALFSPDDSEMMYCKTGRWSEKDPWFQNANNSVVLLRSDVDEVKFKRVFTMTRDWGDPGFHFVNNRDHVCNPCNEVGLDPILKRDGKSYTGWAFCNLCIINAAKMRSLDEFKEAAKAATIIGTLQASYTKMPYLGWVSEEIAKRDALLGVSMTGMMDNPEIALNSKYQHEVAILINDWNAEYATKIRIRPAARTTCLKPEGTSSLALGCVANGIHAHHAGRYIRRIIADPLEVVFQAFRKANPHACVRRPDGKWLIEFPVKAPKGAITKADVNAVSFLETVRRTQKNWVMPGTARSDDSPGLNHNVSNTVHVKDDEWDEVADYLWHYRNDFTGVALISDVSDKKYAFPPNEAVTTEADEARWCELVAKYVPVDYENVLEMEDGTVLSKELACAAGGCEP